jgi:hypothetical protein
MGLTGIEAVAHLRRTACVYLQSSEGVDECTFPYSGLPHDSKYRLRRVNLCKMKVSRKGAVIEKAESKPGTDT